MRRTALTIAVDKALRAAGRPRAGATVVVGLSGGADSVALVDVLSALAPGRGFTVVAAHLDHGLRAGSAADAAFCAELCERLGVAFATARADVRARARREKGGTEEAARSERYAFLREVKQRHGATVIAVAHTLDDQAETFLLRLLRGAGSAGLGAMRPLAGDVIRPMLAATRRDVIAHLEARGLDWREDETNADLSFLRNRTRHELLPYLERRFNPKVRQALARAASVLADEAGVLAEEGGSLVDGAGRDGRRRHRPRPERARLRVAGGGPGRDPVRAGADGRPARGGPHARGPHPGPGHGGRAVREAAAAAGRARGGGRVRGDAHRAAARAGPGLRDRRPRPRPRGPARTGPVPRGADRDGARRVERCDGGGGRARRAVDGPHAAARRPRPHQGPRHEPEEVPDGAPGPRRRAGGPAAPGCRQPGAVGPGTGARGGERRAALRAGAARPDADDGPARGAGQPAGDREAGGRDRRRGDARVRGAGGLRGRAHEELPGLHGRPDPCGAPGHDLPLPPGRLPCGSRRARAPCAPTSCTRRTSPTRGGTSSSWTTSWTPGSRSTSCSTTSASCGRRASRSAPSSTSPASARWTYSPTGPCSPCASREDGRFIVGYGLDHADRYRGLPFLGTIPRPVGPAEGRKITISRPGGPEQ